MSIFDASTAGLIAVFQYPAFPLMLLGIVIGFIVGLLPGLGGATTLALMLPFIYDMPPIAAFAFLLGMHSVTSTTGDITSVGEKPHYRYNLLIKQLFQLVKLTCCPQSCPHGIVPGHNFGLPVPLWTEQLTRYSISDLLNVRSLRLLRFGKAPDDLCLPSAIDLSVTDKRRQDTLVSKILAPRFIILRCFAELLT